MIGKIPVSAKYCFSAATGSGNSRRTLPPGTKDDGTRGPWKASISPAASIAASVFPAGMGWMRIRSPRSTAAFSTRPGVSCPPVRYSTESTGTP